jgi:hypothetical protein
MTNQNLVRNLGIACTIGAALFSANGIWEVLQPSISGNLRSDQSIIDPLHFRIEMLIFGFLCVPGFFAGQLGYYLCGATGKNWFAKLIILVSAVGAILYACGAVIQVVTLEQSSLFGIGIMTTVWLCPVLLGIAALFARTVALWKRLFPFLLLIVPAIAFPVFISNDLPRFGALAINGLGWMIFGYVVFSEAKNDKNNQLAAS